MLLSVNSCPMIKNHNKTLKGVFYLVSLKSKHAKGFMSCLQNELALENLAETIFEDMMKSFKDLTRSEEKMVYDLACDLAVRQMEM